MQEICGRAPCGVRVRRGYAEADGGAGAKAPPCKQPPVVKKSNAGMPRVTPVVCPSRRGQHDAAVLICELRCPPPSVIRMSPHEKTYKKPSDTHGNIQNGKSRLSTLFRKQRTDVDAQADRSTKTCITNEFLREAAPARQLHC